MRQIFTVFVLVAFFAALISGAHRSAGLSTSITQPELTKIYNSVYAQQETFSTDIHNAFIAAHSMDSVSTFIPAEKLSPLAKEILKSTSSQSLESIYYALGVVDKLKIKDATVDKAVVGAIKAALEDEESLTGIFYAGSAALTLRSLKLTTGIQESEIAALVGKLNDLVEDDGTFRRLPGDKEGSAYYAGLALQLLARIKSGTTLSEEDKEAVDSIAEKIESLITLGTEGEGTLEFSHSDDSVSSLATTSSVLRGISSFAAAHNGSIGGVTADHIAQLGQYLVNNKQVSSLDDIYHFVTGLRALSNNAIGAPLVVSLDRASIVGTAKGAEGHIKVRVTDVFDVPVPVSKIYLVKAHPVGKDSHVLISNQELVLDDSKSAYTINFLAAKPEQGFYSLEFRVVPADNKYAKIDSASRSVKVVGSITISDLEIVVADSKEGLTRSNEGNRYRAADQSKKIDDVIEINHVQHVHVQFRVRNAGGSNKPITVQQAFVKFIGSSGQEATFVAQPGDNKVYSAYINVEDVAKSQFKSVSGDYKLEIVVGDSFISNPVHWTVAKSVKITFITSAATSGSRTSGHGPLPEIHHKFRVPEKRPPVAISNAFTLAVLAPLAFLFVGFLALGANISNFPFSGMDFIYAVGFVGAIGANLALLGLYWLRFNLVQTLGYMAVLALPTLFLGQRALSQVARRKDKVE